MKGSSGNVVRNRLTSNPEESDKDFIERMMKLGWKIYPNDIIVRVKDDAKHYLYNSEDVKNLKLEGELVEVAKVLGLPKSGNAVEIGRTMSRPPSTMRRSMSLSGPSDMPRKNEGRDRKPFEKQEVEEEAEEAEPEEKEHKKPYQGKKNFKKKEESEATEESAEQDEAQDKRKTSFKKNNNVKREVRDKDETSHAE